MSFHRRRHRVLGLAAQFAQRVHCTIRAATEAISARQQCARTGQVVPQFKSAYHGGTNYSG